MYQYQNLKVGNITEENHSDAVKIEEVYYDLAVKEECYGEYTAIN